MNLKFIFTLILAALFLMASAEVAPATGPFDDEGIAAGSGFRPGNGFFARDFDRFDNRFFFNRAIEPPFFFDDDLFFVGDPFFVRPCFSFFFCNPSPFFFGEFGD